MMKIRHRQQFPLSIRQPTGLGQGLALGTVSVTAAVVQVALVPTLRAPFAMPTQGGCATGDGPCAEARVHESSVDAGESCGGSLGKRIGIVDAQHQCPPWEAPVLVRHGQRKKKTQLGPRARLTSDIQKLLTQLPRSGLVQRTVLGRAGRNEPTAESSSDPRPDQR